MLYISITHLCSSKHTYILYIYLFVYGCLVISLFYLVIYLHLFSCRNSPLTSPIWHIKSLFFPDRNLVSPTKSTFIALSLPTHAICCPSVAKLSTGISALGDENQKQCTSDVSFSQTAPHSSILKPSHKSRWTHPRILCKGTQINVVQFHPVVQVKLLTESDTKSMDYTTLITDDTKDTRRSNMFRHSSACVIKLSTIT